MNGEVFLDSNVLVYLYAKQPEKKFQQAKNILHEHFENLILSPQIIGELYNVLVKKNFVTKSEALTIGLELISAFPLAEINETITLKTFDICSRYGYSFWDSQILATALLNNCTRVYSEDLHHLQKIEEKLIIINPFLE